MPSKFIRKSLLRPDDADTRVEGFTVDFVTLGGVTFRRFTFEPGFHARPRLKESMGIEVCPYPHTLVVVSGSGVFKMTDGQEHAVEPWDVVEMDADHDFWTTSDDACVMIEPTVETVPS